MVFIPVKHFLQHFEFAFRFCYSFGEGLWTWKTFHAADLNERRSDAWDIVVSLSLSLREGYNFNFLLFLLFFCLFWFVMGAFRIKNKYRQEIESTRIWLMRKQFYRLRWNYNHLFEDLHYNSTVYVRLALNKWAMLKYIIKRVKWKEWNGKS